MEKKENPVWNFEKNSCRSITNEPAIGKDCMQKKLVEHLFKIWDFEESPHMLITGKTATGKTYMLKILAEYLSQRGIVSASIGKNNFAEILLLAQKEIESRLEYVKANQDKGFGTSYSDLGMNPYFIVIDELDSGLINIEGNDQITYDRLLKILRSIVLKGRLVGVFLIAVRQRKQPLLAVLEDNMMARIFFKNSKGTGTISIRGKLTEDFFFVDH